MTLLLVTLLATAMMAGLSWFVSVVHYPLFARVGAPQWPAYHAEHSRRTAWVVVTPMVVELVGSGLLVVQRPDGVRLAPALLGFALALAAWIVTFAFLVPDHGRLAQAYDRRVAEHLRRFHHVRTALWTARAVVLCLLVAAAN